MLEDFDRMMRQVAKTSQQLAQLFDQFWGHGPITRVEETDKSVKLIIETLPEDRPRNWAVRVADNVIYVRGLHSAQTSMKNDYGAFRQEDYMDDFMRAVPIPHPVVTKPTSIRKDGNIMTLTFPKLKRHSQTGWIEVDE